MSAQFSWGPFTHPSAEVKFGGISRNVVYSKTQRAMILREAWRMIGKIVASPSSAILTLLAARRAAYAGVGSATQGYSAAMTVNGALMFSLPSSGSIGGVVVTEQVSHGEIKGADGNTYLEYTFALQRDSFLSAPNDLLEYNETLAFSDNDGAPLNVWRQPIAGMSIKQAVSTSSWYDCVQSGSLKKRTPFPTPEQMLFPDSLTGEQGCKSVIYTNPPMERGVALEYGVSWVYKYRQNSPFNGFPHARG